MDDRRYDQDPPPDIGPAGPDPEPLAAVIPYPACACGDRYDRHRDNGDPRGPGCWLCGCREYRPVVPLDLPDGDSPGPFEVDDPGYPHDEEPF